MMAEATIIWDTTLLQVKSVSMNLFPFLGEPYIEIFQIGWGLPNSVSWEKLAISISSKFRTVTGRGLSVDQLTCIKQRAFPSDVDIITFQQFCEIHLSGSRFSWWGWIQAALHVIESKEMRFKGFWSSGYFEGFVGVEVNLSLMNKRIIPHIRNSRIIAFIFNRKRLSCCDAAIQ